MPRNKFGRKLVLDELFDLSLYREFAKMSKGESRRVFENLIPIEEKHFAFWQDFFNERPKRLDFGRRLKLRLLIILGKIFGEAGRHLFLEAIEIYGIKKYLALWDRYQGKPLGGAVKEILLDEFKHEDIAVSQLVGRKIDPQRIRNTFLGLNDGLVEIVGAVSGFFAAFGNPAPVLIASLTVAVAGSFSMAAGAYVALSSEKEVKATESGKRRFLEEETGDEETGHPFQGALVVGISYFIGALAPVLPIVFGVTSPLIPFISAGLAIVLVSFILAFLSGMEIKKRIALNLLIFVLAISVTYAVGIFVQRQWGIAV